MKIWYNHSLNTVYNLIAAVKSEMKVREFEFIATHEAQDTPIRKIVDHFHPEFSRRRYSAMPDGYLSWALEFCQKHSIDVFIPYLYRHELSLHHDEFAKVGVRLITAGCYDTMELLEDKPSFMKFLSGVGLDGTPYQTFGDLESFVQAWDSMGANRQRLCAKPARGIYGSGFNVIGTDINDYDSMMEGRRHEVSLDFYHRALQQAETPETMMLMPYLTGAERSVDFACLDGELLASVTRIKRGRSQILEHDAEHHEMARKIVEKIKLSGVLNLQTMIGEDGRPYILEVNSRTAGGAHKGLLSGVNLPLIMLRKISGEVGEVSTAKTVVVGEISTPTLLSS